MNLQSRYELEKARYERVPEIVEKEVKVQLASDGASRMSGVTHRTMW